MIIKHSLVTKFVTTSLFLFLTLQIIGLVIFKQTIENNAKQQISSEMNTTLQVWNNLLDQFSVNADKSLENVIDNNSFRYILANKDFSKNNLLDDYFHNQPFDFSLILNNEKDVLYFNLENQKDYLLNPIISKALSKLITRNEKQVIINYKNNIFLLKSIKYNVPNEGYLVLGFKLPSKLLQDVKQLTRSEVLLLNNSNRGINVYSSTIGIKNNEISSLFDSTDEFVYQNQEYMVHSLKLDDFGLASVNFLKSMDEFTHPYDFLLFRLIMITFFGSLLFTAGSLALSKKIVQPLKHFINVAKQISKGNYEDIIFDKHIKGEIGELTTAFDDMKSSVQEYQESISKLAYWDKLTGLPNREKLKLELNKNISNHVNKISLISFDLDRFKHVNDVLGYQVGDLLLQQVSYLISNIKSPFSIDCFARMGGDTFMILLVNRDEYEAMFLSKLIIQLFEKPLILGEHQIDLSAGIGISVWPEDASDAEQLISRSEIAMLVAKNKKNGAVRYLPKFDSASSQSLSLIGELRSALENNEFILYLQPKLGLAKNSILGAEALIRWKHPTRGLLPPSEFIPFAEQTGFIKNITFWIFEKTVIFLNDNKTLLNENFIISINLSTRDLMDSDLSEKLLKVLHKYDVLPSNICLEITESAMMDDPSKAENMVLQLSKSGFKLSIDDFGTGYSSLSYLKQLPVQELKIDKSFVFNLESHNKDSSIVQLAIDLAHHLGMKVVAEGVENNNVLKILTTLGCDEAQGYLIQKPIPYTDFIVWLNKIN